MKFKLDNSYPKELDYKDSQNSFRDKFLIPPKSIYLCGHSLGLQPRTAKEFVNFELEAWAKLGVVGHKKGENPWFDYHCLLTESMADIVGANGSEIVVMNSQHQVRESLLIRWNVSRVNFLM